MSPFPPVPHQVWRRPGFWTKASFAVGAAVVVALAVDSAFAGFLVAIVGVSVVASLH